MSSVCEIQSVSPVADDDVAAANKWLADRGLEQYVSTDWKALTCTDRETFTPEEGVLLLVVPPCEVKTGDEIDAEGSVQIRTILPTPEEASECETPTVIALVSDLERVENRWVTVAPVFDTGEPWFSVNDGQELGDALHIVGLAATRRRPIHIATDNNQAILTVGSVHFGLACFVPCEVHQLVSHSVGYGTFGQSARAGQPTMVKVHGGDFVSLANDYRETQVPIDPNHPAWSWLDSAYFEQQATGDVHALRIQRQTPFDQETQQAAAEARRSGWVTLTLNAEDKLELDPNVPDVSPVEITGPGFTALGGERDVPFRLPHVVFQAVSQAVRRGGTVDLARDDRIATMTSVQPQCRAEWVLTPGG
jgi:hypothetical protein